LPNELRAKPINPSEGIFFGPASQSIAKDDEVGGTGTIDHPTEGLIDVISAEMAPSNLNKNQSANKRGK
jgi:hypothetical protein